MAQKVLIIEDEFDVREDISELLLLEGYTVYSASNGFEGIALAKEHIPDLIICDIMMPGKDGFEVLHELQESPETKTIPFIFLTARATLNDLRQGMDLGADDYLTKPFTLEDLLVAVKTRLRKEAVRQEVQEERMEQLRSSLAYSLPHELRTPLVSILGYAELLMMDSDDPFVRNAASTINESGKRLHHLIENYLLYAQLQVLKMQPRSVMMMEDNVVERMDFLIQSYVITMAERHQRQDDLRIGDLANGHVHISPEHLGKIVQELVDNAFKFSKAGQKVFIASALQQNAYILRIQDEGRGMDSSALRDIGAYQQFARSLYEQQGAGLGLTIAKLLVELYEGRLDITSRVDEGTIVTIYLPVMVT